MRKPADYAIFYCPECDEEIEVEYCAFKQAPPCSNHDDPKFSDAGDPGYVEYPDECPACGYDLSGYQKQIDEAVVEAEQEMKDIADHYTEEYLD